MTAARARRRAGETVEFALAGTLVILLILGICAFGYSCWQVTAVDYELSRLSETLPDDWASRDADEVVKEMILEGSTLDASRLTVENATIKAETRAETLKGDAAAKALGKDYTYRTETWVTVSAEVDYDATGAIALGGKVDHKRTVEGTYLVERKNEMQ